MSPDGNSECKHSQWLSEENLERHHILLVQPRSAFVLRDQNTLVLSEFMAANVCGWYLCTYNSIDGSTPSYVPSPERSKVYHGPGILGSSV